MSIGNENTKEVRKKRRWLRWLRNGCFALVLLSAVSMLIIYVLIKPPPDNMFRGRLESEWISEIKYWDDEQGEQWAEFGDEGIEVLMRGLARAERPLERLHRKWHRSTVSFLVGSECTCIMGGI